MSRARHLVTAAIFAVLLSAIVVHYTEELLQPIVAATRATVVGEPLHRQALLGCESIVAGQGWVHPTALALSVYGDAQAVLTRTFGRHGTVEVLPDYANARQGDQELRCVADYLQSVGLRRKIGDVSVMTFPFEIEYPRYGLKAGWVSGLTQGLVGQVFLAAYGLSRERAFLDAARETGQLLAVAVDQGGVRVDLPDGTVWYEEYAQAGARPPMVLNGHLLALDFLYWMKQYDDEYDWTTMFDSGLRGAIGQIQYFEGAVWSYYDQESNLATRKYQAFHVRQLQRYSAHDATGVLDRAKDRMTWQLYIPLGVFQRLLTQPSRMLLFLTGLIFIVLFPAVWLTTRRWMRQ